MQVSELALAEQLARVSKQLLTGPAGNAVKDFPLEEMIDIIDAHPHVGDYKLRSTSLMAFNKRLGMRYPKERYSYHALVLVELMSRSIATIDDLGLDPDVEQICLRNFWRILGNIQEGAIDYMDFPKDQFDKDLSAASMRLICMGAQKVHEVRLALGIAKRHPWAYARGLVATWQTGTLYEMHTDSNDPDLMADFNEQGWTSFYLRVAATLRKNNVGGVVGTSWFFDPALAKVSPHLGYLRALIVENGGFSIRMGPSAESTEAATRTSRTRRGLVETGAYVPTAYSLIWLRKDLIAWAAAHGDSRHEQG